LSRREARNVALSLKARSHRRAVLLVAAGGSLGSMARHLIAAAVPDWAGFPVGILLVNLIGSFALGLLVEGLARGSDTPSRHSLRLFAGTGLIGGFTTYSALAIDTALLLQEGAAI